MPFFMIIHCKTTLGIGYYANAKKKKITNKTDNKKSEFLLASY